VATFIRKAKVCILSLLTGMPARHDTFDLKPVPPPIPPTGSFP
jgi:hypothetical protein